MGERVVEQAKEVFRTVKALGTIEPTGPIERIRVWLLLQTYRRRLGTIIEAGPLWLDKGGDKFRLEKSEAFLRLDGPTS